MDLLAKTTFKRFIEDIGHFVFKVLSRNKRVQKLLSSLDHGVNLSTSTTKVRIIVERFPKVVDRFVTRLRTGIN